MISKMSISETKRKITSLENGLSYDDTISVTNHGREIFALIRWDAYESIAETPEILSDEKLSTDLRKRNQQAHDGDIMDFDDFKKK